MSEDDFDKDWDNSPEGIAAWMKWYESLEPLIFTPEEEADTAAWLKKRHSACQLPANIGKMAPCDPSTTEEFDMTKVLHGKVHGKTIELTEDVGVPEGQEVEVQVKIVEPARKWGDGILRTAGALADDPYWDGIMEEIHQARKLERRPQLEDE